MRGRSVLRFIHASDFRLGRVADGIGPIPDDVRSELLTAPWTSAASALDAAIEHDVDFVLLNGDVLPHDGSQGRAIRFLKDAFARLNEHGIDVYWQLGREGDFEPWRESIRWPANVHFSGRSRTENVVRDGTVIASISWEPGEQPGTGIGIELLDSASAVADADYAGTCGPTRYDQVQAGSTVHSPGPACGLNPTETGPHGCSLVEVDHNFCVDITFLDTSSVVWDSLHVVVPDHVEEIGEYLHQQLQARFNDSNAALLLLKLRLEAEGNRSGELLESADVRRLQGLIRDEDGRRDYWITAIQVVPAGVTPGEPEDPCVAAFTALVKANGDACFDDLKANQTLTSNISRTRLMREVAQLGTSLLT